MGLQFESKGISFNQGELKYEKNIKCLKTMVNQAFLNSIKAGNNRKVDYIIYDCQQKGKQHFF